MHVVGCLALVTAGEELRGKASVTRSEEHGEEPCPSPGVLLDVAVPRVTGAALVEAAWAQAAATVGLVVSAVALIFLVSNQASRPAPPMALLVALGSMSLIAHATDLLIGVVLILLRGIRVRRVHGCLPLPRPNL